MLGKVDHLLLTLGRRIGRAWVFMTGTGTRSAARSCMFIAACLVAVVLARDSDIRPVRVRRIASDAIWLLCVLTAFVELREADRLSSVCTTWMHDFPARPLFSLLFLFAGLLGVREGNWFVTTSDLLTVLAAYLLVARLDPEPLGRTETADGTV